jgi:hypothetical protein
MSRVWYDACLLGNFPRRVFNRLAISSFFISVIWISDSERVSTRIYSENMGGCFFGQTENYRFHPHSTLSRSLVGSSETEFLVVLNIAEFFGLLSLSHFLSVETAENAH